MWFATLNTKGGNLVLLAAVLCLFLCAFCYDKNKKLKKKYPEDFDRMVHEGTTYPFAMSLIILVMLVAAMIIPNWS